ncbi:MAG: hypothetical protein PW788_03065 [Micavibrio sp.]|nr:hypothetical protein [Micavibrio sp.]
MKTQLFALIAAAVLVPTLASAEQLTTTTIENTSSGYYMNRPTTNLATPENIRTQVTTDAEGNRVVTRTQDIVTTERYKTKYNSDSGFDSNRAAPKPRSIEPIE